MLLGWRLDLQRTRRRSDLRVDNNGVDSEEDRQVDGSHHCSIVAKLVASMSPVVVHTQGCYDRQPTTLELTVSCPSDCPHLASVQRTSSRSTKHYGSKNICRSCVSHQGFN